MELDSWLGIKNVIRHLIVGKVAKQHTLLGVRGYESYRHGRLFRRKQKERKKRHQLSKKKKPGMENLQKGERELNDEVRHRTRGFLLVREKRDVNAVILSRKPLKISREEGKLHWKGGSYSQTTRSKASPKEEKSIENWSGVEDERCRKTGRKPLWHRWGSRLVPTRITYKDSHHHPAMKGEGCRKKRKGSSQGGRRLSYRAASNGP